MPYTLRDLWAECGEPGVYDEARHVWRFMVNDGPMLGREWVVEARVFEGFLNGSYPLQALVWGHTYFLKKSPVTGAYYLSYMRES